MAGLPLLGLGLELGLVEIFLGLGLGLGLVETYFCLLKEHILNGRVRGGRVRVAPPLPLSKASRSNNDNSISATKLI